MAQNTPKPGKGMVRTGYIPQLDARLQVPQCHQVSTTSLLQYLLIKAAVVRGREAVLGANWAIKVRGD